MLLCVAVPCLDWRPQIAWRSLFISQAGFTTGRIEVQKNLIWFERWLPVTEVTSNERNEASDAHEKKPEKDWSALDALIRHRTDWLP